MASQVTHPSETRLRSQIAAHESWAQTPNRTIRTEPARAAFMLKFETQVDPDSVLLPAERAKRAEHARLAHFQRLALKSAISRRKSRELAAAAMDAEAELAALGGESA